MPRSILVNSTYCIRLDSNLSHPRIHIPAIYQYLKIGRFSFNRKRILRNRQEIAESYFFIIFKQCIYTEIEIGDQLNLSAISTPKSNDTELKKFDFS